VEKRGSQKDSQGGEQYKSGVGEGDEWVPWTEKARGV